MKQLKKRIILFSKFELVFYKQITLFFHFHVKKVNKYSNIYKIFIQNGKTRCAKTTKTSKYIPTSYIDCTHPTQNISKKKSHISQEKNLVTFTIQKFQSLFPDQFSELSLFSEKNFEISCFSPNLDLSEFSHS